MRLLRHVMLLAALMLALPSAALAWGNGPANGTGFGTHDWILSAGNQMAVSEGSAWLDLNVALRASGEPDRIKGDRANHDYDRWGKSYGKAPTKVAALYAQAVKQYRAGDRSGASRTVGLLSHYYSDVADPLHTDDSKAEKRMHGSFERAVDRMLRSPGAYPSWAIGDGYNHVSNPYTTTVSTAKSAHALYGKLTKSYAKHGFDKTALAIAKKQVGRAANGVADLIQSIEQDAVEVSASPQVYAHQGVTAGAGCYYVFNTTILRRLTLGWKPIVTTTTPLAGLDGFTAPHLGAGCFYNGRLYSVAENWPDVTNQHIVVYDATTLERLAAYPTGQTHEVAAVCVAPGSSGPQALWVASYFDSSELFEYKLDDGSFVGTMPLSPAVRPGIQGLAYRNGAFYLSVGLPRNIGYLYTATPAGGTKLLYVRHGAGMHEGIGFDGASLLWLVDKGTPGAYVRTLRLPSFLWSLR